MSEPASFNDFPPYLVGVYLAVNAIPDAYFLVDGMECLFSKARYIQGQHDVFSTLLDCRNENRILHTDINPVRIATNFERGIAEALRLSAAAPACGVVLCGAIPTCAIAGTDYGRIVRETAPGLGKPVFTLPMKSMSTDWLGGYEAVLQALAEGMDIGDARPKEENVAVVGYFMDRTEGDHRGNVGELERILRGLGLNPVSVWLSNRPYEDLREARHASTIISLPHAREAARTLARRLGARLIETEIPFGLSGTRRWIEQIAAVLDRRREAEDFIAGELKEVVPRLEWLVPQAFLGRRFLYVGDPRYAAPLAELIEEVGGEVLQTMPADFPEGLDLVIAHSDILQRLDMEVPWIEWGYPSYYTHFFHDEPFLGFRGSLAFLSRMANSIIKRFAVARRREPAPAEVVPPR